MKGLLAAAGAVVVATTGPGAAQPSHAATRNFSAGPPKHEIEIPKGVFWVRARLWGGAGGEAANAGDRLSNSKPGGDRLGRHSLGLFVAAMVPVTPGQVIEVRVGGNSEGRDGGWNGGGDGGDGGSPQRDGTGGGGASELRIGMRRMVVAAGGGGGGGAGSGDMGGGWGADGVFPGASIRSKAPLPDVLALVGRLQGQAGQARDCDGGGGGFTGSTSDSGNGGPGGQVPSVGLPGPGTVGTPTVCASVGDSGRGGDASFPTARRFSVGGGGAPAIALGTSGAGGGGGGGLSAGGGGGSGQAGQGGGGGGGGMGGIADGVVLLKVDDQLFGAPAPRGGGGFARIWWKKDKKPPTIALSAPADGSVFLQGSAVSSEFSCADEEFGSGVRRCRTKAGRESGSPIDTSTVGARRLTIRAVDRAGNVRRTVVRYEVVPVPAGGDQPPPGVDPG